VFSTKPAILSAFDRIDNIHRCKKRFYVFIHVTFLTFLTFSFSQRFIDENVT